MWWTLAAAILASITALVIAFVAYPWQRRKDREMQLHQEKRDVYRRFLTAALSYHDACRLHNETGAKDRATQCYNELVLPVMELLLYANDEQAKAAKKYVSAIGTYRRHLFPVPREKSAEWIKARGRFFAESKNARDQCVAFLRADLLEQNILEAGDAVKSYFPNFESVDVERQNEDSA